MKGEAAKSHGRRTGAPAADPATDPWLHAALDGLAEGVMLLAPDGRVAHCNPAGLRMLGLAGHALPDLFDPAWAPVDRDGRRVPVAALPPLACVRTGVEVPPLKVSLRRPDGTRAWLSMAARPLPGPPDGPAWAMARMEDVTERLRAEDDRLATDARFRLLAENATDLVARHDLGGRFLWVSPSARRILGIEPEALAGRDLFALAAPEDHFRLRRAWDRVLAGGEERVSYRVRHARGRWVWLETVARGVAEADRRVAEVQSSSRDVTSQVASNEALRASEERFRRLAEHATDMILRVRPADGVITYGSPSCEGVIGRPATELEGHPLWAVLHPADVDDVRVAVRDGGQVTFRARARRGGWVWLEARARAVPGADGRAAEVQVAARDVSDRVRAEQEVQAADARLRAAIDAGPDPFLLLAAERDPDGEVVGFRVLDMNVEAAALAGGPREDLVGRTIGEAWPAQAGRADLDGCRAVLDTGVPLRDELGLAAPDGSTRWLARAVVRSGDGVAIAMRDVTARKEHEAEEAALRRVATAVAATAAPDRVVGLVAREAMGLLGAEGGVVARFGPDGTTVVGAAGAAAPQPGAAMVCDACVAVATTGAPARAAGAAGRAVVVAAPVRAGGRLWGALEVHASRPGAFGPGAEARLGRFAELVGLAVQNAEDRERLARLAASDPLTGLANHGSFHERLQAEAARAARHGRPLALVLFDLDHFKEVNDTHGHLMGDRLLAEVGRALAACARPGDTVARIGGEEFGWLLPETGADGAHVAAERGRAAVAAIRLPGLGPVTASAGVCDLAAAGGRPADLPDLADGALYWAKAEGRDRSCVYTPAVMRELSGPERAERMERARALAALKALARAVDAKDPSTREHAERVAALACELAGLLGWPAPRVALLRESALLHDVGKIGVPDAVLFTPAALTAADRRQLELHAAIGGEITEEALTPEQARWVRHHHERWDGTGYPDGLAGETIPEGARILAVADAWDAMTAARHYGRPLDPADAAREVRRCAGTQFWPRAADALLALVRPRAGVPGG